MALSSPGFLRSTEDTARGWVVKTTSTVLKQAMIARYKSGADQGYADNVGASTDMAILGCAEQNGGAQPAGHTLTMSPEVKALEQILPMVFTGPSLTTAHRDMLAYGVDENTCTITASTYIPAGMIMEVIDATHAKVGVGPSFVARAIATQAALDAANVSAASPFTVDEISLAAAVSTTALKAATLITTDPQTVLTAALLAGGIAAALAHPRNFTITGGGTTAHCPTQVVATGTDIDDNALTETAALSSGSATGVKAFKTYTSFVFTGATTGDGSCAIGIGNKFGFRQTVKLRANGKAHILDEMLDAAFVDPSTATIVDATTSPPHGTWAPADPADGADYIAITYEHA